MPTTSPRRTVKLTSCEVLAGEIARPRARPARRRGASARPRRRSRRCTCSPVIASISRSLGRSATGARDDVAGVAEHRHRLADLVDLLQVVRDEQEGDALRLQLAHAHEQALDLVAVELGGRLVEDDEAGAVGERAGDLDQLARLDPEVAGAHVLATPRRSSGRAARAPARRSADQLIRPRCGRLAVDEEVLGDGEVGNDGRVLVDAGDPRPPGRAVGDRRRRLAGEADLAAVGRAQAGQDADQRRLAGAVAADQRVRSRRACTRMRASLQRDGRAVALGDADRLDDRQASDGRGSRPSVWSVRSSARSV